jgi:hypothetical protein
MRSWLVRVAVVLYLAIVATACSKTLKMGDLETTLGSQLNSKLQTTGITVKCPDSVKAEAGGTFECTGTLTTGDTLTLKVTQTDSSGTVTWVVAGASTGP